MTATRPPGYDDRSAAPVEASRRGAHRARPKAIAAIFPVIAGVVVVLLVIGAVYTVIGKKDSTPTTNSAAKKALEDEANSTANPDAGGGTKASSTGKASATSKADKSVKVIVLNSLNVQGLATSYKDKLEAKGWTVDYTDNSTTRDLATTKIYYEDADLKATAGGVRKAIGGIGELSTKGIDIKAGEITVVLGQDTQ